MILLSILLCTLAVLFPLKKYRLTGMTVPPLLLTLLLLTGSISTETVLQGLRGSGTLHPWQILIVFFSTAYVSISVDISGTLDWLASRVIKRAGGNTAGLFILIYLFSCAVTAITSNDIVILIMTPIILYLTKYAKINPLPLLFASFFGANTASMLLLIGNPTNLILGAACSISFSSFTAQMWPVTAVAMAGMLLAMLPVFRKEIRGHFETPPEAGFQLRNRYDALFSSTLLLLMLGGLLFSGDAGIPVWMITLSAAGILFVEDLFFGIFYKIKKIRLPALLRSEETKAVFGVYGLPEHMLDPRICLKRVPWKIAPFITVLFILVEALHRSGATAQLGGWLHAAAQTSGLPALVWGGAGTVLANLLNNQPMSVLLAGALTATPETTPAAAYAVITASNIGANLTLAGSLAGLMWKQILAGAEIKISYSAFFRQALKIIPLPLLSALLLLDLLH